MNIRPICLAGILMALCAASLASAQATQPASQPATRATKAKVELSVVTEDRQKQLRATVTVEGKPLENAKVAFLVKRTFGNLPIGQDTTLDDGAAMVPFPTDLPSGQKGEVDVIATITAPLEYSGVRAEAHFGGAAKVIERPESFPRSLWAPRAPVLLIGAIIAILGAVWLTYAYVVIQLVIIWEKR